MLYGLVTICRKVFGSTTTTQTCQKLELGSQYAVTNLSCHEKFVLMNISRINHDILPVAFIVGMQGRFADRMNQPKLLCRLRMDNK